MWRISYGFNVDLVLGPTDLARALGILMEMSEICQRDGEDNVSFTNLFSNVGSAFGGTVNDP